MILHLFLRLLSKQQKGIRQVSILMTVIRRLVDRGNTVILEIPPQRV